MTQLRNPRWAPPPSSQDLKDLHEPSQSTRLCSCLGYSPIAICCRIRVHPRKSAVKGFLSSDQCHQCKSVVSFAFPAMLCDHPMTAMGPSPVIPRSKGLTRTIPIDAVVFLSWLSANCHLLPYPRSSAQIRGKGFSLSRSVSSVQISGEHCFSLSRRCRAITRSRRWAPPPSSQDLKDLHEPSQSTRLCSCLGYLLIAICSRIRVHPRKSAVKGFLSSDQCHQCKSVVRVAFPIPAPSPRYRIPYREANNL